MTKTASFHKILDRLGFSASTICAIHCAAMPFAISVLPVVGLGFLTHGTFELVMIVLSAVIGTVSLTTSYRLHRKINPILIMSSGALILVFNFFGHESHSALAESLHPYLAGLGGLMIATAHRINMKLCDTCEVCVHEHEHDHEHVHDHEHSQTGVQELVGDPAQSG